MRFIVVALIAWLLLSCGPQKVSGTDTGNPTITATITDSIGNPLGQATVFSYVRTGSTLKTDTLTADSKGQVLLKVPANSQVSFEAYWNDSLGVFTSLQMSNQSQALNLEAGALVNFSVSELSESPVVAHFEQTGRQVPTGVVAKIAPGLWTLRYVLLGTDMTDTLAPLAVQVDDARSTPEDLSGLSIAASLLAQMQVQAKGYVALSQIPTHPIVQQRLVESCDSGGYRRISECQGESVCRVWQWESDWVTIEEQNIPLFVSVVTSVGQVQCVVFADSRVDGNTLFYSMQRVRLQ